MPSTNFIHHQLQFERVQQAFQAKESHVLASLSELHITPEEMELLFVAFKEESILEVYVKNKNNRTFFPLRSYPIVARSGTLGPKRQNGDLQVPEGFYEIHRFNPLSKFYLSLGLDYPNKADRMQSNADDLGGDIFIHGGHQTTGCLPMSDDIMEEIYVCAVLAQHHHKTNIPIYIFPFRMTEKKFQEKRIIFPQWDSFWQNIKEGYEQFFSNFQALQIEINDQGKYLFRS